MYLKENIENKKQLHLLAEQRSAILGHEDLGAYCLQQRRAIHIKMVLATVMLLVVSVSICVPMALFELWPLAALLAVACAGYGYTIYWLSRTYVGRQAVLENLRESQEERRGSIPPPPLRPPPVLTDYAFPCQDDGKRGSLINWVRIDQSRLEFPSNQRPIQSNLAS